MPRRRKLETLKDYQRALKNKYGLGFGSEYKPWLRVQDVKSIGTRSEIYGRKSQRVHHLLSSLESEFFYLAEFSENVIDIREQFPIFPLNYTQKVALLLGIKHPVHPISKEPIIITTDFLLSIKNQSYHAISVKPENALDNKRSLEKLDIERVCWELLDVKFSLYTSNSLTKNQSKNIDWATSPFRENPVTFNESQINHALSLLKLGQIMIEDVCNQLISANITSHDDSLSLIRFFIAEKYIEVDLSYNIIETGILDIKSSSVGLRSSANGTF